MKNALRPLPPDLIEAIGRPIRFLPRFARLSGSLSAGVMLSQALYWSQVTSDPDGWFYKTSAEWQSETCLTTRRQEKAREVLRRFSFWEETRRGVTGTLHYRLDQTELLRALIEQVRNDGRSDLELPKPINKSCSKSGSRTHTSSRRNKEAEITPEITKESTNAISPTPLFPQCESTETFSNKDKILKAFWLQLKSDLMTAPFQCPGLKNDWDLYFRDTWLMSWTGGIIWVGATEPERANEGLDKYSRRLRDTFFALTGERVEFKLDWSSWSVDPRV